MTLVDTSAWVQQLRAKGDQDVRERVESLLLRGEAAWCAPVRLELWVGVGKDPERRILQRFAAALPDLPVTPEVWVEAEKMADRARRKGFSAPAMDFLIAACARVHRVALEHNDADFDWLLTI